MCVGGSRLKIEKGCVCKIRKTMRMAENTKWKYSFKYTNMHVKVRQHEIYNMGFTTQHLSVRDFIF